MTNEKDKYDYIIKVEDEKLAHTQSVHDWYEQRRIENNMKADIEWLEKNKHLLYNKNDIQTHVLISVGRWKYFTPLWKILAYLIVIGIAIASLNKWVL